jgi:hypothetical protein
LSAKVTRINLFEDDVQKYVMSEFYALNIPYVSTGNLDKDLLNIFTIQEKYIFGFQREIKISSELKQKLLTLTNENKAVHFLLYALRNGLNVNPFQSRDLFNYRFHDKLIYDWSIFHFHLSIENEPDGFFTKRTKKVLFVYIDKEKALFLDIEKHERPHNIFAEKKWLEIIDNNWKDILNYASKDIIEISHRFTTVERKQLRNANVNEGILEVNGKFVHSPGLGHMSSGHSAKAMMRFNAFHRWLFKVSDHITNTEGIFRDDFELVFDNGGPKIIHKNSGNILAKYQ